MLRTIRIITRESRLALWQTNAVTTRLAELGQAYTVIPVKSTGDVDLIKPIYEMGIQGVFTRELDTALLNGQAEAAVHSLKDIPTMLAKGLRIAATMERGSFEDILFIKKGFVPMTTELATIATSSIRRKAQWLERFPGHKIVSVRGNVETRVKKFQESDWDGMILAKAGVERLGVDLQNTMVLSWMLPSPAQGAIAIVCRNDSEEINEILKSLHHRQTQQCVTIERDFLRQLYGGCSVPISAIATIVEDQIYFEGAVHSIDGAKSFRVKKQFKSVEWQEAGKVAASEVLASKLGREIVKEIQDARLI